MAKEKMYMEKELLIKRINDKEAQTAKIKARLEVLLKDCDQEEYDAILVFVETGDRTDFRNYLKSRGQSYGGDAWSKANEYYDAVTCLNKYQKQLKVAEDKEKTFAELPEVVIEFKNNLIDRWDRYDLWKREEIKKDYKKFESETDSWKVVYMEMNNKWGRGWRDFSYLTDAQIHKANVTAAETLVMNLVNRTIELTGKITDCQGLHIDQDNLGYSIINGLVIGENGKARVESIGAGGYNIQRYHIRVLVKEVR